MRSSEPPEHFSISRLVPSGISLAKLAQMLGLLAKQAQIAN